jgi:hypothetical protein
MSPSPCYLARQTAPIEYVLKLGLGCLRACLQGEVSVYYIMYYRILTRLE